MPLSKIEKEALFVLVKSLTKAEKRKFSLDHSNNKNTPLFVLLFDFMAASESYDEALLLQKIPQIKKRQLSNLKATLYQHVLDTVRTLSDKKDIRMEIRKSIDYAQILYNKGLYRDSLKQLNQAKIKAEENQAIPLKMEILEFEKLIEARHITRSIENRAEQLRWESDQSVHQLLSLCQKSNLALSLYGMYLKMGHARTKAESKKVTRFFEEALSLTSPIPEAEAPVSLTFYEKINLYQAYSWHAYILQDFISFYRYAQKWVNLFDQYPSQKKTDPSLYIKGLNNLLTAHFLNGTYTRFQNSLHQIELFWKENDQNFDINTRLLAFVHTYTAKLNKHFLEGSFEKGLPLVPEILNYLDTFKMQMDRHRVLIFYYKIACLYFGSGDNLQAITYLNKIINLRIGHLRSDIQCFSRILFLMAHYEQGNYTFTEYLSPTIYRYLNKNKDLSRVLEEILTFFRKLSKNKGEVTTEDFLLFKKRLQVIAKDPYEKRSFLYLDILSWIDSKIQNLPVQEIIRKKFKERAPRL